MARVTIYARGIRSLMVSAEIQSDMDRRAANVLNRAKELSPKVSGDFVNSLDIVRGTRAGIPLRSIISVDPQLDVILKGTNGPYLTPLANLNRLQQWSKTVGRRGSPLRLARQIAEFGTPPAGTFSGRTVTEAFLIALEEAKR